MISLNYQKLMKRNSRKMKEFLDKCCLIKYKTKKEMKLCSRKPRRDRCLSKMAVQRNT